VWV
jgi:2-polyprenyl-6-methoxyphenol hydroxylase-like FAD-dependent oxidoreductase